MKIVPDRLALYELVLNVGSAVSSSYLSRPPTIMKGRQKGGREEGGSVGARRKLILQGERSLKKLLIS
jgi:hypothetical protein